jgi:hypothetical protein
MQPGVMATGNDVGKQCEAGHDHGPSCGKTSSGLALLGTSRRAFLGSGLKLGAMALTAAVGSALILGQAKPADAAYQSGWHFCGKGHCLFYGGSATSAGLCAAGGAHTGSPGNGSSYDYKPTYDFSSPYAQSGWAPCPRCASMNYASANGWSPALRVKLC